MNYRVKTILENVVLWGMLALIVFMIFRDGGTGENFGCVPRFGYRYVEGVPEIVRQATEEAIEKWEMALGDEKLFAYRKKGMSLIEYGEVGYAFGGMAKKNGEIELLTQGDVVHSWIVRLAPQDYDSLVHTALHELGHALGLEHSDSRLSIMSPINYYDITEITQEDIDNVLKAFRECKK